MTTNTDPSQICILWHASTDSPSASLIRVLARRGFSVIETTSGHTAFAAACRCLESARRVVLVLDGREQLHQVDRVLDAIERFAPSLICWEHRSGANPPMVPIVRNRSVIEESPTSPSTTTNRPSGQRGQRSLRLVGKEDLGASDAPKHGPINARDVLDADELDALLAGELGDDRPGKK